MWTILTSVVRFSGYECHLLNSEPQLCASQFQNHPSPRVYPGIWLKFCIWLSCSKHWSAFQQNGFHNSFRIQHAHCVHGQMLLYSLFCWSVWEPLKSPLNVGFLEWTIKLKWTNLRKTRYFGCILSAAQLFLVSSRNAPPWVVFSRIIIFD